MLRTTFVLILAGIGFIYSLQQGPFYALLLYIGNAYFRPEQWVWSALISRLNLSYVSSVWLLLLTLISRPQLVLNSRIVLLLLFLLHTFISIMFSDYYAYGWPFWIEFLKTMIITYLIIVLTTDIIRFRLLLLVIVLCLGLAQAKQGWYYLIFPPGSQNMETIPFLGDNNGVAAGMLMLVPIVAYLARTTQHTWTRYGYRFLLVGCLFRALTTYSRGGFLACAALGSIYLLRTRQKLRTLAGIFVIIMVILPALPDAFWARMHTMQTYEKDTSAAGRLHFWQVAIIIANTNPLLGVGFNAYNAAYNTYDFSYGQYGEGRSVHSSFFGVLAETGYIGFSLWIAILLSAFWSCYCVRKHAVMGGIPVELAHGAAAFEASLVAFVVSGSFLPGQYGEMFWHFIGITIVLRRLTDQHRVAHGKHSHDRHRTGVGVAQVETRADPDLIHIIPPLPPDVYERVPCEAQEYVRTLEARIMELEAPIQQLLARLQRNSRTSSQPPSSAPPKGRRQRVRPKSRGWRLGRRPRHTDHSRVWLPPMRRIAYGKHSHDRHRTGVGVAQVETRADPDLIHIIPPLPPDVYERVPCEAQEYIRALKARIMVLEVKTRQGR